jgi:hypothetical protein
MQKILAVALLAALATANTVVTADNGWPDITLYDTFKTSVSMWSWDGKTLVSLKDITANLKVDADRNKVYSAAKVTVPIFGTIDAQAVIDFTTGQALEYVPFLGLCQHTPLNHTLNLKEYLKKAYDPAGGITQYDGEASAPFDSTKMYKFTSTASALHKKHAHLNANTTYSSDSYFKEDTKQIAWIHGTTTNIVVKIPTGVEKATFADADFTISGCNTVITDPEQKLRLFF